MRQPNSSKTEAQDKFSPPPVPREKSPLKDLVSSHEFAKMIKAHNFELGF